MEYKNINWENKEVDEIYDYFDNLPASEQFTFFRWLYQQYPDKEMEWCSTFEDLRFEMPFTENIAACEEFVAWYSAFYPDEYAEQYEFIERDLCDYYLLTGNLTKLRERVSFITKNPLAGIDTITIRLYFQLLYHGLYEDAASYAKAIYKPIEVCEQIWGHPEDQLIQGLYLDCLQNVYQKSGNTRKVDFDEVRQFALEFDMQENKKVFAIEKHALQNPLNAAEILAKAKPNFDDVVIELNVYFLKYMLENYNIPFKMSEHLWNIISVRKLFGQPSSKDDYFFIDVVKFEEILEKRIDYSLGSNSLEMFGKIWALHYVYEFLEKNGLIQPETARLMEENNLYHRNEMIKYMASELWQLSFVFDWPNNHLWAGLKPLFKSTFGKSNADAELLITDFFQSSPVPQRITDELSKPKKNQ